MKPTDKNKKLLLLLGVAATFFVFAALTNKKSVVEKSSPESLPEDLKKAFDILNEKGYKPETNPTTHKKSFVSFKTPEGEQVVINKNLLITIYFEGNQFPAIQYMDGMFIQNGAVISDDPNVVDGILQIIQNQDYK
jgi:hypothetical protein